MIKLNERVVCNDGFSFSCQANDTAYCSPRRRGCHYTHVEIGFPTSSDLLICEYKEDEELEDSKSIFPYVPSDVVYILITKHGGIKSGEVPKGVPVYGYTHKKGE